MSINNNHLFFAFIATVIAVVLLVTVGNATFDRSEVVKAFTGLLLILGGALAGAQTPKA
jgi:lipoprotein signal peptidase